MYPKLSILTVALACALQLSAEYPSGYYNSLEGKNQAALKTAAHDVIRSHTNISYGDRTWDAFKKTDVRVVDGKQYWWDMYSSELVPISSGHGGLNIEHSVANSWWDGTKNDAYNDIHHLNPSNSTANSRKSNYPLGKVGTVTWTNGVTIVGKPASGYGGGSSNVYEPCDEYKGDFARVFMYMFTCYEDMKWGTRFTWMYNEGQKYPMFRDWAVNMLLEWNAQDPVSDKERNRNEAVYGIQKNRNPFIDLPELCEYIWGSKKTLPFSLGGEQPSDPELASPADGAVYTIGNIMQGRSGAVSIPVQGKYLTAPLTVSISGDSQFSLSANTISATQANTGTTLIATFACADIGDAQAQLTFAGGGLEAPVKVTVKATGVEKTTLAPVTALAADIHSETAYRARWTDAPVTSDYYLVNRTYRVNGEMKTRKYMTTVPYYEFDDRDFGADETYTVQYAVGSDVSEPSNVIIVKAGDVSASVIEADAFEVECVGGGIRVVCGEANSLTVTDISGRTVASVDHIATGALLPLSRGIYILSSPRLAKPLKIFVP